MFQKQVLNLGSVFPFCYFLLLAHCNFPFVYKQFMNVSSVEIELSRSAWSTFFSWCKDSCLGCRNIKNEMDFTMPRKSPCKLLPDPKRPPNNQSFKKKTPRIFIIFQSSSAKIWGFLRCHRLLTCCSWEWYSWGQNCHPSSPWALVLQVQNTAGLTHLLMLLAKALLHFSFSSSMKAIWILAHFS